MRRLMTLLKLPTTEREKFLDRWNLIDRVFRLVQWMLITAAVGTLSRQMKGTPEGSLLAVIAIGLFLMPFVSLVVLANAYEPVLPWLRHRRLVVRLAGFIVAARSCSPALGLSSKPSRRSWWRP